MTVTSLGQDQDCSLKIGEPDGPAPWFLDPGGWSKTAAVSLYFIFPGICTLSLEGNLCSLKSPIHEDRKEKKQFYCSSKEPEEIIVKIPNSTDLGDEVVKAQVGTQVFQFIKGSVVLDSQVTASPLPCGSSLCPFLLLSRLLAKAN
ncbi:hypothetical protein STEG23_001840, partial [Scotinomys teguina]